MDLYKIALLLQDDLDAWISDIKNNTHKFRGYEHLNYISYEGPCIDRDPFGDFYVMYALGLKENPNFNKLSDEALARDLFKAAETAFFQEFDKLKITDIQIIWREYPTVILENDKLHWELRFNVKPMHHQAAA